VFVYPSQETAERGERVGGSGFVVNYSSGIGNWRIRYVVTNAHVVERGGHWVRLNRGGFTGTHIVYIPPDEWTWAPSGDDFAIALLRLPSEVVPYELSLDTLALTREEAAALKVGVGDECYMVGRFIAHGGRVTNNPIARFGILSLMPNPAEPVRDGREQEVEAYLIEMRSHAGFSGSPVFLVIPQNSFRGEFDDTSLDDNTTRFRLLGIDTGHIIDRLPVEEERQPSVWVKRDELRVVHPSDVAVVAPIWKLVDLLEREDLTDQRIALGQELQRQHGSAGAESEVAEASFTKADFEGRPSQSSSEDAS
jgi:hypothetical protein